MNKIILTLLCFLLIGTKGQAQITLEKTYTNLVPELINLSISGKKYAVYHPNELRLYNLDHSLWKTIEYPPQAGYNSIERYTNTISEELFNLDNRIELILQYVDTMTPGKYKSCLIDENSNVLQCFDQVLWCDIYNVGNDQFKLRAAGGGTYLVPDFFYTLYSLPGTLPCDPCGDNLGIGRLSGNGNFNSSMMVYPNPSSGQIRIDYQLPTDVKEGVIDLFNEQGQVIKSYRVDGFQQFLLLNNSELPAGKYYYSLKGNGRTLTSEKMILIR